MVLFVILALMLFVLAMVAILAIGVGGGVFITVFADVIVCGTIIVLIMRRILKKKSSK